MEANFEHFSNIPVEEVYSQLQRIRMELCWLDDDIVLSKKQRELFYSTKNRVSSLLGYKKLE